MGWKDNPNFVMHLGTGESINIMALAERLCKLTYWDKAVSSCGGKQRPRSRAATPHLKAMLSKAKTSKGTKGIRLVPNPRTGWYQGGEIIVGFKPGLNGPGSIAHVMETTLHEIAHCAHLKTHYMPMVNGKSRPHHLDYNNILCEMARKVWGYPRCALTSGWSVGRGYEPSRKIDSWLTAQIEQENPKVMRFFKHPKDRNL